jgi:uncharacterized phage-like protein YoqJ
MIVAGTGHRPDKLGGYGNYERKERKRVFATARAGLIELEPELVISGMAQGWDQELACAAISLGIPFIAAVPFKGQELAWPEQAQDKYNHLLSGAKEVKIVCSGGYAPWKMQTRNEWMVDNSDHILAFWNGTPGGTANCIRYAEKVGKSVINLWSITQNG